MNSWLARALREKARQSAELGTTRRSPQITGGAGVHYSISDSPKVSFCSNDYLGLITEPPDETNTGPDQARNYGTGASRLVCGDLAELREAEACAARLTGYEDAILFPSGYQANVAALPALAKVLPHFYSDELNHASIIDGIRLARTQPKILPHLQPPPNEPAEDCAWWVVETTYSMDGDQPRPQDLAAWQSRGGLIYSDAGHSFGLVRENERLLFGPQPDVTCLPLGKGAGSAGAFILAARDVCDYLRANARGYVFTTGVHPYLARQHKKILLYLASPASDDRRNRLNHNIQILAEEVQALLPNTEKRPHTPIFPLVVGSNERAVQISNHLLTKGWHVQAIRPPTVPQGSARLRITVSAAHKPAEIRHFAADLREILKNHE
jgi:7-keto-8-aminopelargonate synthetase-like enzyme